MINVLSIGNSFSQDAHKWLNKICIADGLDVKTTNLVIGGCSLETHWNNIKSKEPLYDLEINGNPSSEKVSVPDILCSAKWDIITLQQASHFSGLSDTYMPYINDIADYLKESQPEAKLYIHKTWAYETDSMHSGFAVYENNQKTMYDMLSTAYKNAAEIVNAIVIPVGNVIQALREQTSEFNYQNGGLSLCRDGFHLSQIYGRYAAAAAWYETVLGGDITNNNFLPENNGEVVDEHLISIIKQTVHSLCSDKRS